MKSENSVERKQEMIELIENGWRVTGFGFYPNYGDGNCQLKKCGHPVKYVYILSNNDSISDIEIGSTCVVHYEELLATSDLNQNGFRQFKKMIKEYKTYFDNEDVFKKENQKIVLKDLEEKVKQKREEFRQKRLQEIQHYNESAAEILGKARDYLAKCEMRRIQPMDFVVDVVARSDNMKLTEKQVAALERVLAQCGTDEQIDDYVRRKGEGRELADLLLGVRLNLMEENFIPSILGQEAEGKILSEKQLACLRKCVDRHRRQINVDF